MKDNTSKAKQFLQQAIREMPQDFALSEARYHLSAALSKIEQVEKKRDRREQVQQQNNQIAALGPVMSVRETINYIDNMIDKERQKIEEIVERRKKRQQADEDDLDSPLLG